MGCLGAGSTRSVVRCSPTKQLIKMTASEGDWTNREYGNLRLDYLFSQKTGKTARMVQAAEELLRAGETVAICVLLHRDARQIERRFSDILDVRRWMNSGSLIFTTPDNCVKFIGRRIGTLFIDHSVVERGGYTTKLRNFVEAVSPRVDNIVWGQTM